MRTTYLAAVIIFAVIAHFVLSQKGSVDPASDKLSIRQHATDSSVVIFAWDGAIDPPMALSLERAFENWKGQSKRIIFDLNSPGGLVSEGERVIKIMNKMKRTHDVETYVGPGAECLSMCVPIYLQGRLRVAAATSQWMFHEPSAVDSFTGERTFTYEYEKRQSSQDFYYRFFKRSEMDPEWREKLRRQWRFGDVWKTGRELKRERSNIVTIIETRTEPIQETEAE